MSDHDRSPESLYRDLKRHHKPPSAVRQQVLRAAKRTTKPESGFKQWFTMMAGAMTVAACVFVALLTNMFSTRPDAPAALQVQLHGYAPDATLRRQYADAQVSFASTLDMYQQKLNTMPVHHAVNARVLNVDSELVLVSCEQTKLMISSGLVSLLKKEHQLPDSLSKGQYVELVFNQEGMISEIKPASAHICT